MQCFTSQSVLRVRQCSANIKENCASHDCSASHHCRLVSSLFEIRHAKTSLVQTCHKTKTRKNKVLGDVQNKLKTNQFHLPRKFPWENHATCRSKKRLFGFGCSMRHATKTQTCSGVLSSGTNCGQNGLCKFFVIHTGRCPVDVIHPCMFLTLAPTKTLCEQIAKTS